MVKYRNDKVQRLASRLPDQEVDGDSEGDILVVSWGGTKGAVNSAVAQAQSAGKKISHAHFSYIMPLPKNTADIFKKFKKIIVCELNGGQFVNYLRMLLPEFKYEQYNKVQGLPFTVNELITKFNQL